jgi:hypothetical protein
MMRPEVTELVALGSLVASDAVDMAILKKQEELIRKLVKPATDEEARALVKLFGPDESFGLAWALVHFIESAPGWPLIDCLTDTDNEWIRRLRQAAINAGLIGGDE